MNLFGFQIQRRGSAQQLDALRKSLADEVRARADLQAKVNALEQQAVRVNDMTQIVASLTGGRQPTDGQFPFGPLSPLPPQGTSQEQTLGPRRWQYPVGANIQYTPRSSETVSFDALRNFARLYDIARICIQVRKEELQGLPWSITTTEEGREDEFKAQIATVKKFFEKPDRKNTFDDWLGLLVEDIFVIDAMTLHKQRTRGGELYALRVVDGATIHPVIDELGEIYGYQQVIYGVPRTAYIDALYAAALPDADKMQAIFPLSQIIYRPRVNIPDSLYGFPPLEWVIMSVNQALRKQVSDLSWFTEGNTPEGFVSMPDGLMTLEQARAFEDDFNALLAGNEKQRRKLRFIPWKAELVIPREFTTDTAWDEFLLKKTCAALGVSPQEIGFTADVNRATGEMQENVQYRRSTEPITQFFESMLTEIIQTDFGFSELKFTFHAQRAEEDILKVAQADDIYIKNGSLSIDEVRSRRNLGKPFGIDRPFITTPLGVVYLDEALGNDFRRALAETNAAPLQPAADTAPAEDSQTSEERAAQQRLDAQKVALIQWRENSLNRLKQGKRPKLGFQSAALSADMRAAVAAKLQHAQTADQVRAAFALAKVNERDLHEPQRNAKLKAERQIQSALSDFWQDQNARIVAHLNAAANDAETNP